MKKQIKPPQIRKFDSGATRDTDQGKLDFEGFESPLVRYRFAEYMHGHRTMLDGSYRDSDNWQQGFPERELAKSLDRHVMDVLLHGRGYEAREGIEEALCGVIFNANAYLLSVLKARGYKQKENQ